MSWIDYPPIDTYERLGINLLIKLFRITFFKTRTGDKDAAGELEKIVTELTSRDIAVTRNLRSYLARFMNIAAKEMHYEEAAVYRDMLKLYDERVLSNR